jgi:hypothetical protein
LLDDDSWKNVPPQALIKPGCFELCDTQFGSPSAEMPRFVADVSGPDKVTFDHGPQKVREKLFLHVARRKQLHTHLAELDHEVNLFVLMTAIPRGTWE